MSSIAITSSCPWVASIWAWKTTCTIKAKQIKNTKEKASLSHDTIEESLQIIYNLKVFKYPTNFKERENIFENKTAVYVDIWYGLGPCLWTHAIPFLQPPYNLNSSTCHVCLFMSTIYQDFEFRLHLDLWTLAICSVFTSNSSHFIHSLAWIVFVLSFTLLVINWINAEKTSLQWVSFILCVDILSLQSRKYHARMNP